jgi:hypothetical protein
MRIIDTLWKRVEPSFRDPLVRLITPNIRVSVARSDRNEDIRVLGKEYFRHLSLIDPLHWLG